MGGSSLFSLKNLSHAVSLLSGVGKIVVFSSDAEFPGPQVRISLKGPPSVGLSSVHR